LKKRFPFPMQYMGSKNRISDWILDSIQGTFPRVQILADVMAGSGAISHAAHQRGLDIIANDIQPYSATVLSAAFTEPRVGLDQLINEITSCVQTSMFQGSRARFRKVVQEEECHLKQVLCGADWSNYAKFSLANMGDPSECTKQYDLF